MGKPFDEMSLEELQDLVNGLNDRVAELKAQLREVTPYLSARQKEFNDAEAAKGDPRLTQGISLN